MPLGLLKYGLSRSYPVRGDIPQTPDLRSSYDVVIIGGGGHGLAARYYLAKDHGISNVAVLEKGYLAGGNTARNTTIDPLELPDAARASLSTKKRCGFTRTLSQGVRLQCAVTPNAAISRSRTPTPPCAPALGAPRWTSIWVRGSELIDPEGRAKSFRRRSTSPTMAALPDPRRALACGRRRSRAMTRWPGAMPRQAARAASQIHQRTEVHAVRGRPMVRVRTIVTNRGRFACGARCSVAAGWHELRGGAAGRLQAADPHHPLAGLRQPAVEAVPRHDHGLSARCTSMSRRSARGEMVMGGGDRSLRALFDALDPGLQGERHGPRCWSCFPFLGVVKVLRQWAGMADMTPDFTPIMGATPLSQSTVRLPAGAPGASRRRRSAASAWPRRIATGRVPDILQPFALERFGSFQLINEMGATAASH